MGPGRWLGALMIACAAGSSLADGGGGAGRLAVSEILGDSPGDFRRATGSREFRFPGDHGSHPDYRSEWWYVTAILTAANDDQVRFGLQFTIFRQGLARPPAGEDAPLAVSSVWMVHTALIDLDSGQRRSEEHLSRAIPGVAGVSAGPGGVTVQVLEMVLQAGGSGTFTGRLTGRVDTATFDLTLASDNPPRRNGAGGLSPKGPEAGNASWYYSVPDIRVGGQVSVDDAVVAVQGDAWLDREWSTSVLSNLHQGWDWIALHLADGRRLMAYHFRPRPGVPPAAAHAFDYAVWYLPDGTNQPVALDSLATCRWWTDPFAGRWPVCRELRLGDGSSFRVDAAVDDQLMDHRVRYWEGVVRATGTAAGWGYLEMTGYGG